MIIWNLAQTTAVSLHTHTWPRHSKTHTNIYPSCRRMRCPSCSVGSAPPGSGYFPGRRDSKWPASPPHTNSDVTSRLWGRPGPAAPGTSSWETSNKRTHLLDQGIETPSCPCRWPTTLSISLFTSQPVTEKPSQHHIGKVLREKNTFTSSGN